MLREQEKRATVFLSHSSKDKDFVSRLADDLNNMGIGVWFDKWEIKVGDSIVDKINQGISDGDYLAVVLSKSSVSSPWVNKELNAGLMRELQQRSVFILPVLLEPCQVPPLISDKRYADFSVDYSKGLESFLEVFEISFAPEKVVYEELKLSDLSHGATKRYAAEILVSPDAPKPLVQAIIHKATHAFRTRTYYSNEIRRQRFGNRPADVVWLYVYRRVEDRQLPNWICRSSWVSPELAESRSTLHVSPSEEYKDVRIHFRSEFFIAERVTKEDFLPLLQRILSNTEHLLEAASPLVKGLTTASAEDGDVIGELSHLGDQVRRLYFAWGQRPVPPLELHQLESAVGGVMTFADNVFLPFSEKGLATWAPKNRVWLAQDALRHYEEELSTARVLLKLVR